MTAAGVARAVATLGGLGRARVAPGTVGSLAALVVPAAVATDGLLYLALLVATTAAAVWSAGRVVEETLDPDPHRVVVDEAAGMLLAMLFIPATPLRLAAAFLLFRLFDIVKPQPARAAERLPGGWGVTVDDLVAGLYANLAVRLLAYAVGLP